MDRSGNWPQHLGIAANAIGRALCQFQIIELRYYKFKVYRHEVVRDWLREEDLLRRTDWEEIRRDPLSRYVRDA